MKLFRFSIRFFLGLLLLVVLFCIGLYLTNNEHLIKAVKSTYLVGKGGPTIDDYIKFDNRVVNSSEKQAWIKSQNFNQYQLSSGQTQELEKMEPAAFLVAKDGQLIFEQYWAPYSPSSKTNSFSMAKSFTSLCIGAAIKEGKIESVDQKVADFIPEFQTKEKSSITIKNLLTMSSGLDFGESYGDPFGFMAKAYYGTDLYDLTVNKPVKFKPNEVWHYQGGNSLLLSFIIKKATGKSLSDYFSEKFWKPIGSSQNALWTVNKEKGLERAFCCFYSNARDYAKIGQLMLDSGEWNGVPLISKEYFIESIQPINIKNESQKLIDYYGYQWWLGGYNGVDFFYARGILGQYIVIVPSWNVVFVRLGHKRDPTRGVKIPSDLYSYFDIVKEISDN